MMSIASSIKHVVRRNGTLGTTLQNRPLASSPQFLRDELVCKVHPRLDAISPSEWDRLFPNHPDSAQIIQLTQQSGMDGFTFYSIIVRAGGQPVLCVPLFETKYHISNLLDGKLRRVAAATARWLPQLLAPRILGVGFVEGEWGQVGYDPNATQELLEEAWGLALKALHALAKQRQIDLLAFVNFTTDSGRLVPITQLKRFARLESLPYGQVPVVYSSLEEYLASLSKSTRKDLRRKLRSARGITVQRTTTPGPWLETMYQWYLRSVERGEAIFGTQRRDYFEQICESAPGAEYVFYFLGQTLIAFNLVVVKSDCLVDKYFGMHELLGRQYHLYFISWLENIRYCIAHRIPLYHAGQGAEATKHRLGVQWLPSAVLFHHRNPVIHYLLQVCVRPFIYRPQVQLALAELGGGLEVPSSWTPDAPRTVQRYPQPIS